MSEHWCLCIASPTHDLGAVPKSALLKRTQWDPDTVITISFLGGSAALQARVLKVARRWIDETGIRLSFARAANGQAGMIRIAFRQGAGSWSYLGTDCLRQPVNEPTMNFGWLTDKSTDAQVQEVVLHEFGHALGLIHEHQSPFEQIPWDKAAVYKDLMGPPNDWDKDQVDFNMFETYSSADASATVYDPKSIMHYPIPAAWTGGKLVVGTNADLSALDKDLIRKTYT